MTRQVEFTAPPEPENLRHLHLAGLSTYQISRLVNQSQSTVSRKIREIADRESTDARRRFWMTAMYALVTLALLVIAAAQAWTAWSG